jgi:hypothetical protein
MKRTIQDLIVTGFGMITSVLTAIVLAASETKFSIALYSFTLWFVIPVGALLSGFAAASGYYFGARIFHHRPTRLLIFNVISVAVTTYFLLNYLEYRFLDIKGQAVSELIPFGQYMDIMLSHQSLEFRIRGAKLGETGDLGSFGYVMAVLQIVGFAVGGLCVYTYLRAAPFCDRCNRYLKKTLSTVRYTSDASQLQVLYGNVVDHLKQGSPSSAVQLLSSFGQAKYTDGANLNGELKLWKCTNCPQEFVDFSINKWNGKDWKQIPELYVRDYLPTVAGGDGAG